MRLITLTWNRENDIVSNCFSEKDEGLKKFGRVLVPEMERRGIVIDLAHASDRGFFDVCDIMNKPCVVSHANSRKLFRCERNITDEMYMRISQLHGCVGVTFEPLFGAGSLEDIVRHVEHFCALDEKCVGIGSDFDGISHLPEGICGARSIYDIANRLLRLNYSEKTVAGVMCENFMRVFKEILQKGIA
ncbi:MAG: membrane dipeptidase [Clostridia bacterium]|nr:membrane dipeptidase [Clostridia bacterium]